MTADRRHRVMGQGVQHPTYEGISHPGRLREESGQRAQESHRLERRQRTILDVNAALVLDHFGGEHANLPEGEYVRAVDGVDAGPVSLEYLAN